MDYGLHLSQQMQASALIVSRCCCSSMASMSTVPMDSRTVPLGYCVPVITIPVEIIGHLLFARILTRLLYRLETHMSVSGTCQRIPSGTEACGLDESPDLWLQSSPAYYHRLRAWQNRGDHLCVKTHRFQKSRNYLPLKQRSSCISLLHMDQHGNIAPIIVLISHF